MVGRCVSGVENNEKLITNFVCLQRKVEIDGLKRQKKNENSMYKNPNCEAIFARLWSQ